MMSPTANPRVRYSGLSRSYRQDGLGRNRNIGGYRTASAAMGPISMSLVLLLIVGVLALLYLTQITKTTVYGYQVSALSDQRQELANRNQALQVEAARLQAIARIQSSRVVGSLQPETGASFANSQSN